MSLLQIIIKTNKLNLMIQFILTLEISHICCLYRDITLISYCNINICVKKTILVLEKSFIGIFLFESSCLTLRRITNKINEIKWQNEQIKSHHTIYSYIRNILYVLFTPWHRNISIRKQLVNITAYNFQQIPDSCGGGSWLRHQHLYIRHLPALWDRHDNDVTSCWNLIEMCAVKQTAPTESFIYYSLQQFVCDW